MHAVHLANRGVTTKPDPADSEPYVVALVGSPRPNGNTSFLVDVVLAELERHNMRCEKIMLSEYNVLPCEGHDECGKFSECPLDDDMSMLTEKVYAAQGLILATPVYYENVSAQMKAFIDRNCFSYEHNVELQPQVAGLIAIAASTGTDETIEALKRFLSLSSSGSIPMYAMTGHAQKAGEAAVNGALGDEARRLAHKIADALSQS